MELPLGLRVATAGFVVGRLLREPPAAAVLESLNDEAMRRTWPLSDDDSLAAMELLSTGTGDLTSAQFDYRRLFVTPSPVRIDLRTGPGPADHVGEQVLRLAEETAQAAQADLAGDPGGAARARESTARLAEALGPVLQPILDALEARASTPLYRAVPGLARGFLAEEQRSR